MTQLGRKPSSPVPGGSYLAPAQDSRRRQILAAFLFTLVACVCHTHVHAMTRVPAKADPPAGVDRPDAPETPAPGQRAKSTETTHKPTWTDPGKDRSGGGKR